MSYCDFNCPAVLETEETKEKTGNVPVLGYCTRCDALFDSGVVHV